MAVKRLMKKSPLYSVIGPLYALVKLSWLHIYDLWIFIKFSGILSHSKESTHAKIITLSHAIERGLSLKESRKNFGIEKINELLQHMSTVSSTDKTCTYAASALNEYLCCNPNEDLECSLSNYCCNDAGGTNLILKSDLINDSSKSFDVFSKSRHSIRDFSKQDVDVNMLREAISIAQGAPSACNRQSTRVYIIAEKDLVLRVLELQGGANGFKEYVNKLIIVASDIRAYLYANERKLHILDSGMFGMSLLYALHYLNLGACPLMWTNTPKNDTSIRKSCNIDENHCVVFAIAVGHLEEEFKVAKSPRLPLDNVCYLR